MIAHKTHSRRAQSVKRQKSHAFKRGASNIFSELTALGFTVLASRYDNIHTGD